jgi:hypothetical protein
MVATKRPSAIVRESGAISQRTVRIEARDELVEDALEAGIVVAGVGSNEVDDLAIAVGGLLVVALAAG